LAIAIAAFIIVSPARAAAPLCDPRGATMLAPPPQLQEIPTSIDVDMTDDCLDQRFSEKALTAGHAPTTFEIHAPDPGSVLGAALVLPARESFALPPPRDDSRPADGVSFTLERPPRRAN
jgi:hypothetical protein